MLFFYVDKNGVKKKIFDHLAWFLKYYYKQDILQGQALFRGVKQKKKNEKKKKAMDKTFQK